MNYSRQSLLDRLQAARHTLMGSALGRGVCKATTDELGAPKRKHLEYLQQCTYEVNVSIPQLVELLIDRTRSTSWVVTFKALITIHYLLNNGNERFGSCFASCGHKLNLSKFFDRSSLIGFEMSAYIRKYAAYIDSKRDTHRVVGHDLCRVKRGKEDGFLRKLPADKLFHILHLLNNPIDCLTNFTLSKAEMMNSIVGAAYRLLCRDAIRLYACYNDGVINLLEKFFDLNKKECAEALELYRGFLSRSEKLAQFLKSAEQCGIDRAMFPELVKAPDSLLETLECHLQSLEQDQAAGKVSQRPANFDSELLPFSRSCIRNEQQIGDFDSEEKRLALEDEARAMTQFNKADTVFQLKRGSEGGASQQERQPSLDNMLLSNDLLDLNWDRYGGGASSSSSVVVDQRPSTNGHSTMPPGGSSAAAGLPSTFQSNPFSDDIGFSQFSMPTQPAATPIDENKINNVNPFGAEESSRGGNIALYPSVPSMPPATTGFTLGPPTTTQAGSLGMGLQQPGIGGGNPFLGSGTPAELNFQQMGMAPRGQPESKPNVPPSIDWLS